MGAEICDFRYQVSARPDEVAYAELRDFLKGSLFTALKSQAGDRMLRKLLVGSAHYILGPFGPDTDLRQFGKKLYERGGKNTRRRATVAVARKLAVLLDRLRISGEVYELLRHASFKTMSQTVAAWQLNQIRCSYRAREFSSRLVGKRHPPPCLGDCE